MFSKKLAFVVQRYGLEVNGGAEHHCRLLAEHLSEYFDVEIITTCAMDYMTWKNEYPPGCTNVNGVQVRRFPVDSERDVLKFNKSSEKIFAGLHSYEDEITWMKMQGPYSTGLLNYLKDKKDDYDCFIFFTYLYCTTFFGLPLVREKAFLVPTAHDEPPIYLSIFDSFFDLPYGIICNTAEEKKFIESRFKNQHSISSVVGVGIDFPADLDAKSFTGKYGIDNFILYVGRIDESKGCRELFDFFLQYKKENKSSIKLVLMGQEVMKVPKHPDILSLGFISDLDKFNGISAANLLIMPSKYESLSMVLLEAWLCNTAVLVNGNCAVLKDQCIKANAGLYYTNYDEFREGLNFLLRNNRLRTQLGLNGNEFTKENYSWDVIESKYLRLLSDLKQLIEVA
jgi:glycosyltransferase involved in cell wall biosynthesis